MCLLVSPGWAVDCLISSRPGVVPSPESLVCGPVEGRWLLLVCVGGGSGGLGRHTEERLK